VFRDDSQFDYLEYKVDLAALAGRIFEYKHHDPPIGMKLTARSGFGRGQGVGWSRIIALDDQPGSGRRISRLSHYEQREILLGHNPSGSRRMAVPI